MSVKNQLIKIAYENPELRDSLLPIINKVADDPKAKNQELWDILQVIQKNSANANKLLEKKEMDVQEVVKQAAGALDQTKKLIDTAKGLEKQNKLEGIPMKPFQDLETWWKNTEKKKEIRNPPDAKVAGDAISKLYYELNEHKEECMGALGIGPKARNYHK